MALSDIVSEQAGKNYPEKSLKKWSVEKVAEKVTDIKKEDLKNCLRTVVYQEVLAGKPTNDPEQLLSLALERYFFLQGFEEPY